MGPRRLGLLLATPFRNTLIYLLLIMLGLYAACKSDRSSKARVLCVQSERDGSRTPTRKPLMASPTNDAFGTATVVSIQLAVNRSICRPTSTTVRVPVPVGRRSNTSHVQSICIARVAIRPTARPACMLRT